MKRGQLLLIWHSSIFFSNPKHLVHLFNFFKKDIHLYMVPSKGPNTQKPCASLLEGFFFSATV